MASNVCVSAKALIGMSAAIGFTITLSTPARAETVDLICNYADHYVLHIYLDTDRQSVVEEDEDDKRYGPFSASISDTFIRWTFPMTDWEYKYTIDRVAGTMRAIYFYRGIEKADLSGRCRRATKKF